MCVYVCVCVYMCNIKVKASKGISLVGCACVRDIYCLISSRFRPLSKRQDFSLEDHNTSEVRMFARG